MVPEIARNFTYFEGDEIVLSNMSGVFASASEKPSSRLDSMIDGEGTGADTTETQILKERMQRISLRRCIS